MKAILHIGTEKTGTTSIQSFLTQNRKFLVQYGYTYLQSAGLPSNRKLATYCFDSNHHDDHHEALGIVDLEKREQWRSNFAEDFDREIRSLDRKVHTVFISNEQLHSRLFSIDEISRVREILGKYFKTIEVYVYLRRQDKMACSLYSTALKCGHSMDDVLPNVPDTDHYYNFEVLLNKWCEVFGTESITARVFERGELVEGDLICDFLNASGSSDIDLDKLSLPGLENESLLPMAQEFLKMCNQVPGKSNPKENGGVRSNLVDSLESIYSGKPRLPARSQAVEFYQKFRESNNRVAQQWFNREKLFDESFSEYPDTSERYPLTAQEAIDISMEILRLNISRVQQDSQKLSRAIESNPADTATLLANYFSSINPTLARQIKNKMGSSRVTDIAA